MRAIADHVGEWAGIPVAIDGEQLIVEPSYPFASVLNAAPKAVPAEGLKVRSSFYSTHKQSDVVIFEDGGRLDWALAPAIHHLDHDLRTLGCSFAWGIEQESKAVRLLGSLVGHVAFKQYLLTGMFLEQSRRTGIFYVFRRLKPTVALRPDGDQMRILCALCMHPIAYYKGSWAGAMCPTDDVIAHLMLMRGDEPMYWRRANQHPAYRPEAGL